MVETALICKEFDFMEDKVIAVKQNEQWVFSPKRICENIGISWPTQCNKLKKEPKKFSCIHMNIAGPDEKVYEMIGIPVTHINTWILSINANKVKNSVKKDLLEKYQAQLSNWLYEVGFLGAAINENVSQEEVDEIIKAARERHVIKRLSLDEKRNTIISLPDLPGMLEYKSNRLQLITDVQLGIKHSDVFAGSYTFTDEHFYEAYMVEGWCEDKIICSYPQDFTTPESVHVYAEKIGLKRDLLYRLPLSFTQMASFAKAHRMFGVSIADIVIEDNIPAADIRYGINWIEHWLCELFKENEVDLPQSTRVTQAVIYKDYMGNPMWHTKRDAYFSVYNCCIDCRKMVITSKNFAAHHLHYHNVGKEHPSDLVPLCRECHSIREKKEEV